MPLTLPYTINPLDNINAEPLQGNFQAIADKFSGGIVDADLSSLANITGSKVATNTLPGDRVATGTITQTQMAANSIGTTQVIANAITKDKLTVTAGSRITKTQMELTVFATVAHAIAWGAGTMTAITADLFQTTVGGVNSWAINLHLTAYSGSLSISTLHTIVPVAAIPVATVTPLAVVLKNLTQITGNATVDVDFLYLANS